jgi:phosphohistidine phosphatase SixA
VPVETGLVYGLVNVRTDGVHVLTGTLEESGSDFDVKDFRPGVDVPDQEAPPIPCSGYNPGRTLSQRGGTRMRNGRIRRGVVAAAVALLLASGLLGGPATGSEGSGAAAHQALTVLLVRHAEKAADAGDDPPLTAAGRARAAELARMLAASGVTAVYASEWQRTQETVAPLAERLGLTPEIVPAGETNALARKILDRGSGAVLVAAHSNTIGPIIEALGGDPIPPIDETDYDDLFVVTVLGPDKATVLHLTYGASTP